MAAAGTGNSGVIFSNAAAGLTMTGSTLRDNAVEHVMFLGSTPFQHRQLDDREQHRHRRGDLSLSSGPPSADHHERHHRQQHPGPLA